MINIIVTILGSIVLVIGLISKPLSKSPLPPTLVALFLGILLGPEVTGIFDLKELGKQSHILEVAARLTLGIGLVSVGLRIPKEYVQQNWGRMMGFISVSMLLMWGITTCLVYYVLGLPWWLSVLIGAILAPTDPIAATPIVSGSIAEKNLPDKLRRAISFESGANDGLSYLFVLLPIALITKASAEEALKHWSTQVLLWEVFGATAYGLLLGYVAGKLLQTAERHGTIAENWRLVYTVALAFIAVGSGKLIKSDEVLVVFAAAVTFTQVVSEADRGEEKNGQEAVNRFFSFPIFALLGTAIPWKGWMELGWSGVLLALAVLFLRRIPVLLLAGRLVPGLRGAKEMLFMGWFGPIAVAAIYYAALAEQRLSEPLVWHVVSLVICASVVAHGLTAAPLTRLYGRMQT